MSATTDRLSRVYDAALGATVGFLPTVIFIWVTERVASAVDAIHVPLGAVIVWIILTAIIFHEWWLSVDFLHDFPISTSTARHHRAIAAILNVLYIIGIIAIPVTLVI